MATRGSEERRARPAEELGGQDEKAGTRHVRALAMETRHDNTRQARAHPELTGELGGHDEEAETRHMRTLAAAT